MGGNCRWQTYKTGRINDLRVAPLQSTNLALSYTIPSDDKEYFLNVYYKTKKKDGLINADWELPKIRFSSNHLSQTVNDLGILVRSSAIKNNPDNITLSGDGISIQFDA